jgi:hypothetical protein
MYLLRMFFLLLLTCSSIIVGAQNGFSYDVSLQPVQISGLPGLHSYSAAQYDHKWMVIGGRKDGLHARQPFNAFPESQNNTDIYVIDPTTEEFWSSSILDLPVGLKEQLQSTNMCFQQVSDTLYIVGGYGYSNSQLDHITYDGLTTVDVPGLMNAVINNNDISPFFKQISDPMFAVTGGHLTFLDDMFYLVGGHRFDGNYNPMGMPTYTQSYTNQIRKFSVTTSDNELVMTNLGNVTDEVHLHRRDYNLLPIIDGQGDEGLVISSGVFQVDVDLPFLYPVEISSAGIQPVTSFNQYLCNYHTANVGLYDASSSQMHTLFFGGMSQYYYNGNDMIEDDLVPFVKTISRLTRDAAGQYSEYKLSTETPVFMGSSAEFFIHPDIPVYGNGVIQMNQLTGDSILIGYVFGGIKSNSSNPFSVNQTNTTAAETQFYEVWLIQENVNLKDELIPGNHSFDFTALPNKGNGDLLLNFDLNEPHLVTYYVTNQAGQLISPPSRRDLRSGKSSFSIDLPELSTQVFSVTAVFDGRFFVTKKVVMGL